MLIQQGPQVWYEVFVSLLRLTVGCDLYQIGETLADLNDLTST